MAGGICEICRQPMYASQCSVCDYDYSIIKVRLTEDLKTPEESYIKWEGEVITYYGIAKFTYEEAFNDEDGEEHALTLEKPQNIEEEIWKKWERRQDMEGAVYEFVADAKQKFPGH